MIDTISMVEYTPKMILAERKDEGNRIYHKKWDHSLVLMHGDEPVGVIIGYERAGENSEQYPANSIYISELAVAEAQRGKGLAKKLLAEFLKRCQETGFLTLSGPLAFSIQTNSADFNNHVVRLYQSFGFKQRATKIYDNRVDVVLGWNPEKEPEL